MQCPQCGSNTQVVQTRTHGTAVYRVRRCSQGHKFNTVETLPGVAEALSPAEKRTIRRVVDRILTLLGVS